MDAVYSGQAGALALVEGASVCVLRGTDDVESLIAYENLSYLFVSSTDTAILRGTSEQIARKAFTEPVNRRAALQFAPANTHLSVHPTPVRKNSNSMPFGGLLCCR